VLNLNGHNQTVNDLSGVTGTALGLIVNNGSGLNTLTIGTANTTTYAGLIDDNNNAGSGQIGLEIDGDGTASTTLTLSGVNNYSGPVLVNGATVILGNNGGQTAIGSGPITLENNGSVQMAYYGSGAATQGTFVNSVLVPAGTTGNLLTMGRGTYSGNLTVHGTLNLTTSYVRSTPSGDWSASDGQINILPGTGGGALYLNNAGNITFGIAAINLASGATIMNHANTGTAGNTITIGELTGNGTIEDTDAGYAGRITTYVVGGRNTDATFNGTIQNDTRITGINKVGTKSWTLAGTDTFTGPATVTAGSLIFDSGSFPTGTNTFTVYSGALLDVSSYGNLSLSASQTLAGGGSVSGAVTLANSDILSPGVGTVPGTLALLNGLTESGPYVTNDFNLSSDATGVSLTNSLVSVTGDLTLTGTNLVVINPLNTILGAGTYTLFKYTGNLNNESGIVPVGATLENNLAAFGAFATNSDVTLIFSNAQNAVVMIVKPTGQSLTWLGGITGTVTNNWDVNISSNWLNAATSLTNFLTYDSVSFGDGSTNFNVVLAGALAPGSVTVNSTNAYTFAGTGKITGSTGISKSGTNVLTISNTGGNDFTGQVLINGGTLKLGVATALGATNGNTVIASGATLDLNGFAPNAEPVVAQGTGVIGSGAIVNNGAQLVNAGFTGNVTLAGDTTFGGSNRWDIYNGSLTGNGHNLTKVGTNYIVLTSLGDIGVNNISVQSGYFTLIGNTTLGTNGGTLNLLTGGRIDLYATTVTNAKPVVMNGATISSSSGTNVYGGPITLGAGETFTATTPLVLQGALSGVGSLLKNGAGNLTLFGTNTYAGSTTVAAGSLLLAGTSTIASSTLLDVNAGAILDVTGLSSATLALGSGTTLKGAGSVNGSVIAPAGSTVAPGESVVGTLTVSNTVTLAGNALLAINKGLSVSNSVLAATTIHYGGMLTITNLGAALAAGDSFKLFSAGTITGSFTGILPATPGAGLLWNTNSLATGTLSVLAGATVNTNPPPLLSTINGSQLILSWPTNIGWTLQSQTNSLSTGLSGNWVSIPGSTTVNSATNTINPSVGTVFYRLVYTNTP
jgi:autotransporter-associated beta strand protein